MSRGGRGGRGGGRGGMSAASRMNSGVLPFEIDKELEDEFAKMKAESNTSFPDYFPHLAGPVTAEEKRRIKFHLDLQDNIQNGWMSKAIEQLRAKNVERTGFPMGYNPFEDVPHYGKTNRATEKVPKFSEFPFVKEHFPKELWEVIDPKGESNNPDAPKKKKLKLATKSNRDKLAEFDENETVEAEEEHEDDEKKNPDEEDFEEVQDDDFDEGDEEDLGNDDYNAERYFEGGEEDYEDGGAGGDDAGDECLTGQAEKTRVYTPYSDVTATAKHFRWFENGRLKSTTGARLWQE